MDDCDVFFEMSRIVESPEMLKGWVQWFRQLRIPCVVAKTEGGYSLWRKGMEAGRKRSHVPSVLLRENVISSFGLTAAELELLKKHRGTHASDRSGDLRATPKGKNVWRQSVGHSTAQGGQK